jgi:hypothetical protein
VLTHLGPPPCRRQTSASYARSQVLFWRLLCHPQQHTAPRFMAKSRQRAPGRRLDAVGRPRGSSRTIAPDRSGNAGRRGYWPRTSHAPSTAHAGRATASSAATRPAARPGVGVPVCPSRAHQPNQAAHQHHQRHQRGQSGRPTTPLRSWLAPTRRPGAGDEQLVSSSGFQASRVTCSPVPAPVWW